MIDEVIMRCYVESDNELLPRHIVLSNEERSDFIVVAWEASLIITRFFGTLYENRLSMCRKIQSEITVEDGIVKYRGQVIGESHNSLTSMSATLHYKDVIIFRLSATGASATIVVDSNTYELVGVASGRGGNGGVMQTVASKRLTRLMMETPFIKWA